MEPGTAGWKAQTNPRPRKRNICLEYTMQRIEQGSDNYLR